MMVKLIWLEEVQKLRINEGERRMSKLNWPPEETFQYEFKEMGELTLVISYDKDKKSSKTNKSKEESDRTI